MANEYLPYGGFEWLKNVDEFDVMSISGKREIGYFLEVDLGYRDELHKLHNDYLLAPEKLTVSVICCIWRSSLKNKIDEESL